VTRLDTKDADFIVPDSREGWVELLRRVLEAHFITGKSFSYSTICIRSKGTPIKGFGGVASGPEELCWGMAEISKVLNERAGKKVRPIDCLDVMNIIGYIVVSGNVRRSAQIAIGDFDDRDFLRAKRWDLGNIPNWRAMSNNSVVWNDFSKLPDEFWDGYIGKGEPYGLINLRLSRKVGRLGDERYPDPHVQGFNPCVPGETEILTKHGYQRIDQLVGQNTEIWNGFEWSAVTPKITGHNRPMVIVRLSNGRSLKCTTNHKFVVVEGYGTQQKESRVEAASLIAGSKLIKHNFPVITVGVAYLDAYSQGFFSAEGSDVYKELSLYEAKFICEKRLNGTSGGSVYTNVNGTEKKYLKLNFSPRPKNFIPHDGDLKSRLDWFAGLLDGGGTELKEGGSQVCSVDKEFLLNAQRMLTTMGVASKVVKGHDAGVRLMPDGKGGYKKYDGQASYRLCLGATQMQSLIKMGLKCERMTFSKSPDRDASQFITVISVEEAGIEDTVYCFTEPKRNLGCFDGIVTGQCAEQSLNDKETCALGEVFLPNITSKEEMIDVVTSLYRIIKHSLKLPCHLKETEKVVHKNMRMGIGVTGYLQATEEQKSWLPDVYEALRAFDKEYSRQHGFPTSIKLSTVKPSGTLSLLAGVTSGVHPGYSRHYIRRIRISSTSPLVELCRRHGYHVEYQRQFDGTEDHNTVVVSFPCKHDDDTVIAADVSAIDQMEFVKRLQTDWSDNSVSCTVYYKKEELDGIKEWLAKNYNQGVKTISFLLHSEHGFIQAPLEEISADEYERLRKGTKPITGGGELKGDEDIDMGAECVGGVCPIR